MVEHYIAKADYDRLITALASIRPDPLTGVVDEDDVKTVLGEVGDVWPTSIFDDFHCAEHA